jgi:Uma2 family endonuclease
VKANEEPAPYGGRETTDFVDAQRIVLRNISWGTFERLLKEMGDNRGTRLAYCDGELEIMSPYSIHEGYNRMLQLLVFTMAEETETRIKSLGSLTCKLEAIQKGLEPDSCFYIQRLEEILGLEDIEMEKHPAPDLVIEVDISNSSMNKFPIYEGLKVPEVWRHDGKKLRIYHLQKKEYVARDRSLAFPTLNFADVMTDILSRSHTMDDLQAVTEFRKWVRSQGKG